MNAHHVNVYADDGTIKEIVGFSEQQGDIPLKLSKYTIHQDDSISQIKNKILLLYPEVSYDELYLFSKVNRQVNLQFIYQNIAVTSTKIGRKHKKTLESAGRPRQSGCRLPTREP